MQRAVSEVARSARGTERGARWLRTACLHLAQLSTWCGDGELIAEMRTLGQMAALALPRVGYATNADHGAGCDMMRPRP